MVYLHAMNVLVKKWLIVILLIVVSFGCSKPKNIPQINMPDFDLPVGISVSINNAKWTGGYTAEANWGSIPDTVLNIESFNYITSQRLHLTIHHWSEKVGSYEYPPVASNVSYPSFFFDHDLLGSGCKYYGVSGNVIITKISTNNIQGMFNAKLVLCRIEKDTLIFANGVFNIPYNPL